MAPQTSPADTRKRKSVSGYRTPDEDEQSVAQTSSNLRNSKHHKRTRHSKYGNDSLFRVGSQLASTFPTAEENSDSVLGPILIGEKKARKKGDAMNGEDNEVAGWVVVSGYHRLQRKAVKRFTKALAKLWIAEAAKGLPVPIDASTQAAKVMGHLTRILVEAKEVRGCNILEEGIGSAGTRKSPVDSDSVSNQKCLTIAECESIQTAPTARAPQKLKIKPELTEKVSQERELHETLAIPEYAFSGPGRSPWGHLTPAQRLEKIGCEPLHGATYQVCETIELGPVYASVLGLSCSDMLSILLRWLHRGAVSEGPTTEISNAVLSHAWKLIEYVVRSQPNVLIEIKSGYGYEEHIAPRVKAWEESLKAKETRYKSIELFWGAGWREKCIAELEGRGHWCNWTEAMASHVMKLAIAATQRCIERKEAWDLVLTKVDMRRGSGHFLVSDVKVAIESLLDKAPASSPDCGCPFVLSDIIQTLPTPRSCSTILSQHEAVSLLTRILTRLAPSHYGFVSMCHSHLRRLASGSFGLLNNTVSHLILAERLCAVYQDLSRDGENPHYQSNPHWFRKPFRPLNDCCTQQCGLYKHKVMNPRSITHAFAERPLMSGLSTFIFDRESVFARFSSLGKFQEFLEYGTVRIPGLFEHLDSTIIDTEFEMYEYHFSPPPGTKPMGWLRIMYHSLIQQAIRQDPAVYALHCAAREDGCWRFISYPYYTKSTSPTGEKTGFYHFDLNVSEFLSTGKSQNVVQSAVTLVHDETPQGCTVLVPGFHQHVREWWSRHPDAPTGGETTNIIHGKTYTKQDELDFGPFIPYPCKAGELRITRPDIPHGSTPVSRTKRRVVFPWLIGIRDNHETLDVDTTETWSELAACHRDMIACRKSTSGRSASAYGRPEGKWPGVVVLGSTSCLGDALVGRRRWDDPEVVIERDLLLGDNGDGGAAARAWLQEVRRRMRAEFERCWEIVKRVEREEFGKDAFFSTNNILA